MALTDSGGLSLCPFRKIKVRKIKVRKIKIMWYLQ